MEQTVIYGNDELDIQISPAESGYSVRISDSEFIFLEESGTDNEFMVLIDGQRKKIWLARDKDQMFVFLDGRQYTFSEESGYNESESEGSGGNSVTSPMPGKIIQINCKEGDSVEENDTLVIVEAMKMENLLRAPVSGTVVFVGNEPGDMVDAGTEIVRIETSAD